MSPSKNERNNLQTQLLGWYDRHRRVMPWRALPGETPDPYQVWLSEIMLQQTTVTAVKPYFEKFISRWPRVENLAEAELDDILQMWAGLGYYARARNLHKCARVIVTEYNGIFPDTPEALKKLPGIGPYTAAAVASIAFNRPCVAVDGNVERVVARLCAIKTPMPEVKPTLKAEAESIGVDNTRPSDFTQAFMELGATVCTPKTPKCMMCPWRDVCKGYKQGIAESLPRKASKKAKPKRFGDVYMIYDDNERVLMRRRDDKGLLGGMMEFPTTDWVEGSRPSEIMLQVPFKVRGVTAIQGEVRHVFTHLELYLAAFQGCCNADELPPAYKWVAIKDVENQALPSLMKKVWRLFGKSYIPKQT